MRYGMVIDLKKCVGCYSCVMACKVFNGTPRGVYWARVLEKEVGKYPNARRLFVPVLCNHCKDPACRDACPTGATEKSEETGVVTINYDTCIGCRACMIACPYGHRFYLSEIRGYFEAGTTPKENLDFQQFQKGVVTKCVFCEDRIEDGLDPACVEICPASARYFGDLDNPDSKVSQLITQRMGYQLRPETGADPSVYYLD